MGMLYESIYGSMVADQRTIIEEEAFNSQVALSYETNFLQQRTNSDQIWIPDMAPFLGRQLWKDQQFVLLKELLLVIPSEHLKCPIDRYDIPHISSDQKLTLEWKKYGKECLITKNN